MPTERESPLTEPPAGRRKKSPDTWRMLRWVLAAQLGFAAVLLGTDLAQLAPQLTWPSSVPELTDPIGPGDQIRRFTPNHLPERLPSPGNRPILDTGDMPGRLVFATPDWQGEPVLTLTGRIAEGDALRVAEYLEMLSVRPKLVYLNSPGGSVRDALAIGRVLRMREMNTIMSASDICLSACPYVLAAGITRTVDPDAMVGVHQHYFGQNTMLPAFVAIEKIQRGQGEVMSYLQEMGVDPLIMRHALVTPSDEIYLLTPAERDSYRLTNDTGDQG
ncbi:ATP-dependent Clp protease proteolytic subunit [Phaeobacter sp. C3_T13_0]|uniref:ATP-dependent Clp protease proteolytic subunit n=1 Tax=Phaeobacter cretensis TaxID=3342641 RepID=UPI0039BCE97B